MHKRVAAIGPHHSYCLLVPRRLPFVVAPFYGAPGDVIILVVTAVVASAVAGSWLFGVRGAMRRAPTRGFALDRGRDVAGPELRLTRRALALTFRSESCERVPTKRAANLRRCSAIWMSLRRWQRRCPNARRCNVLAWWKGALDIRGEVSRLLN